MEKALCATAKWKSTGPDSAEKRRCGLPSHPAFQARTAAPQFTGLRLLHDRRIDDTCQLADVQLLLFSAWSRFSSNPAVQSGIWIRHCCRARVDTRPAHTPGYTRFIDFHRRFPHGTCNDRLPGGRLHVPSLLSAGLCRALSTAQKSWAASGTRSCSETRLQHRRLRTASAGFGIV